MPGLTWGGVALARGNPEAFREFVDFHRWYFSLSVLPDDKIAYVGGWKNAIGDRQLNPNVLAYPSIGLLLSAPRQNLRIHGAHDRRDVQSLP